MELKKTSPNQNQAPPVTLPPNAGSEAILAHHLKRNVFKVGDAVVFKKPRRNRVYGAITHIETDPELVTWSKGKTVPNFITVRIETKTKTGWLVTSVKTYESKLMHDRRV